MCRSELLFLLGLLGICAAQGVDMLDTTNKTTCEGSTAAFCVRTCCPQGQNSVNGACAVSAVRWHPSFLSADVNPDVVGKPIEECQSNEELKIFSKHIERGVQFELHPSGKLTIKTSEVIYDLGHNYCFRNVEHEGVLYESVHSCVSRVVPQVPGLPSIDNVTEVSFHKCCPVGQMLAVNGATRDIGCVNSSSDWMPDVLHDDPTQLIQLPPQKARIEAGEAFRCPQNTVPQYLHSASSKFYLEANSQLLVTTYNITIKPYHFCLDLLKSSSAKPQSLGQFCSEKTDNHTKDKFEELCREGVCTRKCCAPQFILSKTNCILSKDHWRPTFHDGEHVVEAPADYTVLHGRSKCDGHSFMFSRRLSEKDVPFLQVNGDIQVTRLNLTFKAHQCCLDYETYFDEDARKQLVETAICCQPIDQEAVIRGHVNSTLLSISSICLFVMLTIYMMVPKLRNLHGKCLMSHAAALFVAFFLTVFNQVIGVGLGPGCDALGLMLYYSFIAALFWLNVMSFDIWWTFAHLRTQAPSPRSLRNRFIRHSLYAWGVPLLMTIVLAFLNYASYDTIPKGAILRPALGERKCFLSGKDEELYYFYVPIFIVTGVNIIFFAATAYTLYQAEKSSRILNRKRTARDRLKVYVNLFIIMEVSWIAECLSTQIGPIQAWYFTDVINASQGLLIFLLFIVRGSTRRTIQERFAELRKHSLLDSVARASRPTAQANDAARTSVPTKTTTTTSASSSSTARKGSENEAFQMTEKTAPPLERNGAAGAASDDVTPGGREPAPHD